MSHNIIKSNGLYKCKKCDKKDFFKEKLQLTSCDNVNKEELVWRFE